MELFVHHTAAEREYAYDRNSHVGTLDKALDQASSKGWIIVDMKKDWNTILEKMGRIHLIDTFNCSSCPGLRDLGPIGGTEIFYYH